MEEPEIFNGIDGSTGRYLPSPTSQEFVEKLKNPPLDHAGWREYRWWIERYGLEDPNRSPVQEVDPKDLGQAGWAVIFGSDIDSKSKEALQPLLRHRENQAGAYYRVLEYEKTQTKLEFLSRRGAGSGPANPRKVPYYLLIVGDPGRVPYRFQYELDVQYAVGRIHFEKPDDYRHYAESVVAAEKSSPRPQQLTLFGVRNPEDRATQRTTSELIEPLAETFGEVCSGDDWSVRLLLGEQTYKADLKPLLGGRETPALLFTACHGMVFPNDPDLQLRHQGSLLCQDWPGPRCQEKIPDSFYFSAQDVEEQADLLGLIAFHFACYSAGTPDHSDFEFPVYGGRVQLAPRPFLAPLAQRLLSHPNGGALAVLGHIDRAWTTSFNFKVTDQNPEKPDHEERQDQIEVFESILRRLMEGHPVGSAMEFVNQRHAELSVELTGLWADRERRLSPSRDLFTRMWRANNDARNFVVLGDPAVRLAGSPWPMRSGRPALKEQIQWRQS